MKLNLCDLKNSLDYPACTCLVDKKHYMKNMFVFYNIPFTYIYRYVEQILVG